MDYTLKLYEFEAYLYEEERSINTVKKYMRDVRMLCDFLKEKELCKQQVLTFKEWLIKEYAPNSVNSMIASVNKFLGFIQQKVLRIKPIKMQRKIYANPQIELTREEYARLLDVAEKSKDDRLSHIIQTICQTGIRV